jgi:hypothetical protein
MISAQAILLLAIFSIFPWMDLKIDGRFVQQALYSDRDENLMHAIILHRKDAWNLMLLQKAWKQMSRWSSFGV